MTFTELGIAVRERGNAEQRVPCPQCNRGDSDDALGVNLKTGVFHCFRCGWKGCVGGMHAAAPQASRRADDPAIADGKRERLRRIWKQCVPLHHADAAPVRRYLESRALGAILSEPPRVLRAHPGLEYWDKSRNLGRFPAMVALYQASDEHPVTLHVTYLRPNGATKAAVPVPKKTLAVAVRGSTKGGAIRLYAPRSGTLGIAEGIESALSLHLIRRIPVWSARCADNLEHIRLPKGLRRLEIGVDIDASGKGRCVAEALAERVYRFSPATKCHLIMPELSGLGDLNDELQRTGTNGDT
jgi:putative DNA primase/helicase